MKNFIYFLFSALFLQNTGPTQIYARCDTNILTSPTFTAATIETINFGDELIIEEDIDENFYKVKNGYVLKKYFTQFKDLIFYPENKKYYSKENAKLLCSSVDTEDESVIEALDLNTELFIEGCNYLDICKIKDEDWLFIQREELLEQPLIENKQSFINYPSGESTITPWGGVYYYNGRKETYYSSSVLYHYRTPEWTLDEEGFYHDSSGYYVVAASDMAQGTVFDCSKGSCIVLDSGCAPGVTDYYVLWP